MEDNKPTPQTDAIVLLMDDHKKLRGVFDSFKRAAKQDNQKEQEDLVATMAKLLKVHTHIENDVFYAETRKLVPDLNTTILESYVEHHLADVLLKELSAMSASNENYVPKTNVLIDSVTRHMDEEELEWFPQVRAALTDQQLSDMGTRMAKMHDEEPGMLQNITSGIKSLLA